jgi:PAS domain S-box-containing protein
VERPETNYDVWEDATVRSPWVRYHQILEFAPHAHLATDMQGIILEANYAAATLVRRPREFLTGKPLGLLVPAGTRFRFYECLARLGRAGGCDEFASCLGLAEPYREVFMRVSVVDERIGRGRALHWTIQDITERRRAESDRDVLLQQLVTAQEDERQRMARELHDSVGQLLAALLLGVQAVRVSGQLTDKARRHLDDVQRIAVELGEATHDLAARLRPTALDDLGLEAAVGSYLDTWAARSGITTHFQSIGLAGHRLPKNSETILYRVIQEGLTNVVKHAGAKLVSVVLECQDGHASAIVEDDGVGFDPDADKPPQRLGLIGMRERVSLAGGTFLVESRPGEGTTVIARIPFQPPSGTSNGEGRDHA